MASELEVTTIRGLSSGANANQILVPSGQTLHAPGHVIQTIHSETDSRASYTSTSLVNVTGSYTG